MWCLYYTSPVVGEDNPSVIEGFYESEAYASLNFEEFWDAVSAAEDERLAALCAWAADETGSPYWAVTPSGEVAKPPKWAEKFGFRFVDLEPGSGAAHYFHVTPL